MYFFKRLAFFGVLCFFAVQAAGQRRVFHGGLLGGLSASQVHNDNFSGYNKLGLYAGAYIQTELSDKFLFETGMQYVAKGSRSVKRDNQDIVHKYVMRLGYIEFPVLLKFRIEKWDFELGPSFGFLLHSKELDQFGEQQSPTSFEPFELAVTVGVNYMVNEQVGVNLRHVNSIFPIRTPTDGVYYTNGQAQYNIVLTLAVRYFMW
jgi:hypothetical protein